jgi:AAA+ ATPase superfamily predicted ATPase
MPIQFNEENEGTAVVVRVTGKLVDADYEYLVPELARRIRQHGKLRMLFELIDFHGWEPGAFWDELKFDLKHFADIERIAIVGDKKWEQEMTVFSRPFTTATMRYFDVADTAQAWKWWREPKQPVASKG